MYHYIVDSIKINDNNADYLWKDKKIAKYRGEIEFFAVFETFANFKEVLIVLIPLKLL